MLSVVATSALRGREPVDFLSFGLETSGRSSGTSEADDGEVNITLKV